MGSPNRGKVMKPRYFNTDSTNDAVLMAVCIKNHPLKEQAQCAV